MDCLMTSLICGDMKSVYEHLSYHNYKDSLGGPRAHNDIQVWICVQYSAESMLLYC